MTDFDKLVQLVTDKVMLALGETTLLKNEIDVDTIEVFGNQTSALDLFLAEHNLSQSKLETSGNGIVITQLSLDLLVRISNMMPGNKEETYLLDALLNRKKVYIINSGRDYVSVLDKCTYGSKQYIQECEKQWEKYGAQFVDVFEETFSNNELPKVITREYLQQNLKASSKELTVNHSTIVTPFAKDYLKEMNVKLKYEAVKFD